MSDFNDSLRAVFWRQQVFDSGDYLLCLPFHAFLYKGAALWLKGTLLLADPFTPPTTR